MYNAGLRMSSSLPASLDCSTLIYQKHIFLNFLHSPTGPLLEELLLLKLAPYSVYWLLYLQADECTVTAYREAPQGFSTS